MCKKAIVVSILTLCILLPTYLTGSEKFVSEKVIDKVKAHSVGIAVIYWMDEDTFKRKLKEKLMTPRVPFIPTQVPRYYIAYIGSGTVIKPGNLVITVSHLFEHGNKTDGSLVTVWFDNEKHYNASIIKQSKHKRREDDYTLLRIEKKLKLPGIKIAKKQSKVGDKVLWSGSTGGYLFRLRFGYLESWRFFLQKEMSSGKLSLTAWHMFPYMCVHPGGPGDSGGGIFNEKGELTGMMYCGVGLYLEEYIFSNPLRILKDFLKDTPGERTHELDNE